MGEEILLNKAVYTANVPEDRLELIERISAGGTSVVMFVGDVDSGKTTTLTFVANHLIELGYTVAVVDADIGQKGILPPATVSLGIAHKNFSYLGELTPVAHYFIGKTTPAQFMGEVVVGVKRLVELGKQLADVVLIDTTGFVRDVGFDLKRLKVEATRPDLLVIIGGDEWMIKLAESVSSLTEPLILEKSPRVQRYSLGERKELRRLKWASYFEGSRPVVLNVPEVRISGTSMFSGRDLTPEEKELIERLHDWIVIAGWKGKETYTVVKAPSERGRLYNRAVIKAIDFETLSNLLVGLLDERGLCIGVGILKWPNFHEGRFEILTPLSEEELSKVVELRLGRIRVMENGEELGLLRREDL